MIEYLAEKIAQKLKKINPEETASVEIMKFSLSVLINGAFILILSLIIGLCTGKFFETAIALFTFALLRSISGGYHLPVSEYCVVVSTAILVTIPHLPITQYWCIILTIASLVLVILFAPSKIENQTRIPRKYYPLLKVLAILMVSSNFLFLSGVIAISFFIQSVFLIRKWEFHKLDEGSSTS